MESEMKTPPRLHLHLDIQAWTRSLLSERHEFYVDQVKKRILSQFPDIEAEADQFADEEYQRLASMPGDENSDLSEAADAAMDRATSHYMLLAELREQTTLGALAGMYHQWEKELRTFIENELGHELSRQHALLLAWKKSRTIEDIFDLLQRFGWDCRAEPFYPVLESCRLVVNVYKHGKGESLNQLVAKYPEYLPDPIEKHTGVLLFSSHEPEYEHLSVTQAQFDAFADAIRQFWKSFPDKLDLAI